MIFCFSGEGNSLFVAHHIKDAIGGELIVLSGDSLISPELKEHVVPPGEPVIWTFPVYSWGVPPVMVRFMTRCRIACDTATRHHLVLTCGDDVGLAHRQWRKIMKRQGWTAASASSVIMPNTYTLMKGFDTDSPDVERAKLQAAPRRVSEIVNTIKSGEATDDVTKGSWAWVKSLIVYPWFVRFCMSPKPFHPTSACVSCGKCAWECPLDNITMTDGKPRWGQRCALCLRCYHTCPHHAVAYGTATRDKGRYLAPRPR